MALEVEIKLGGMPNITIDDSACGAISAAVRIPVIRQVLHKPHTAFGHCAKPRGFSEFI
jgi:hypothetical protein